MGGGWVQEKKILDPAITFVSGIQKPIADTELTGDIGEAKGLPTVGHGDSLFNLGFLSIAFGCQRLVDKLAVVRAPRLRARR